MIHRPIVGVTVSLILVGVGCASALRPLDPDSTLAGTDPSLVDLALAAELRAEAGEAYARRPDLDAVRRAEELWLRAATADPERADDLMGAVRAQVWLVEHLPEAAGREATAIRAVDTARWCRRREPERAACHYWLALSVGVQANEIRSTAADGVEVMLRQLELAIAGDETLDQGGPHRVLARLYLRAPGWPTGPGDADAGLEHALRAVELAPDYPPNLLTLAEAYGEVDEVAASRTGYRHALEAALRWQAEGDPDAVEWVEEARDRLGLDASGRRHPA